MFGRLVTCTATVLAALLLAGPAGADSTYGNKVNTSCNVKVTAVAGKAISGYINVKGNASDTITGTVTLSVYRSAARAARVSAGSAVWSKSVRYTGTPLRITGPTLDGGSYRAVATFDADPGVYLDCECFGNFRTRAVEGEGTGNHSGNGNSGIGSGLPNTGGPSQWWLVAGFGLVLAGGSTVMVSRRRHAHA